MDLKDIKKDAQVSMSQAEKPDGFIYSFVKGKKEFHPIESVVLAKSGMTVGQLVEYCKKLEVRLEKLKEVNAEMLDKIVELERKVKLWIG